MSKLTIRIIPVLVLLLLAGASQANAQGVSPYFGIGSAFDSAGTGAGCPSKQIFDDFTGVCETAPTIGGVFGVFGADFMILPHLGVNAEDSFHFSQADYLPAAGLKSRTSFYDFNAVFQPTAADSKIVPVIVGGVGGARESFYYNQQICAISSVCTNFSQQFATANHFQVHGGVGVKIYVKGDLFIKPQFDIHWVRNLTQQYGRSTVPEFTISVGYTLGRH